MQYPCRSSGTLSTRGASDNKKCLVELILFSSCLSMLSMMTSVLCLCLGVLFLCGALRGGVKLGWEKAAAMD